MLMTDTTQERTRTEQSILGSMVLEPEAAEFAIGELSGSEFSLPEHRAIFTAVCRMTNSGKPIDAVTLSDELTSAGTLAIAGGFETIVTILEAVPHAAHTRFYVQQLQELHQRDSLKALSERLRRQSDDLTREPSETIEAVLGELEGIQAGVANQSELITVEQALQQLETRSSHPETVVPTSVGEIDRLLRGGLRPGQVCVIAGRPGSGKSALMGQLITSAAKLSRAGLIASLEMTAGELAERGLKTLNRQQFMQLPVWFAECSTFAKLVAAIRLAKRRHNIQLAAIDYLQLIESPVGKNEMRERQIASMSRAVKRLAMELQIPILLGSQLNRDAEKRGRPSLADLRESGAIEQDADIVVLIAGDAESDERELIIAKHRGGPCGIVKTAFDKPKFWFNNSTEWTGSL